MFHCIANEDGGNRSATSEADEGVEGLELECGGLGYCWYLLLSGPNVVLLDSTGFQEEGENARRS